MEDCPYTKLEESVDWSKAPAFAEFYANNNFYKIDKTCKSGYLLTYANDFNIWECSAYKLIDIYVFADYAERQTQIQKNTTTKIEFATSIEKTTQWSDVHYNNYYQLTPEDIEAGQIKIDAYFVNKVWKLNSKDDTGVLFHSLKTIARFGDKNPIEREIKALYNQTKRMAQLHGIELD